MKGIQKTYQRSTYFDFLKIETTSWREKVRFFERRYEDIIDLDYKDQLEIWYDYGVACHELGEYHKFINIADELIPSVIKNNITHIRDVNVYNSLLYKKACSHINLEQIDKGLYILSELIKIDANELIYIKTFIQASVQKAFLVPEPLKKLCVASVIIFILISISELLIVSPFFENWSGVLDQAKIVALIFSFVPAIIYFSVEYFKAQRSIRKLLKYARTKQKQQ